MLSPTLSYHSRMAPPVRPSRSLEGLEQVVPPLSPKPSSTRLFLNKPLPAEPLPEEPECSAMWSDSSDSESTLDSIIGPSEPRYSTDSYPIFVSSGNDFDDLVDHSAPADQLLESPQAHKRTDSIDIQINIDKSITDPIEQPSGSFSETQYSHPSNWSTNRTGTNHYFREKKWDYFPELAPSAVQASGRVSPNMLAPKSRKKANPLEFAKGKYRWHSLDRGGLRNSIKTYVHRTLSRDSADSKSKEPPRPATAPMDDPNDVGSILGKTTTQQSLVLDTNLAVRTVSVATSSSSEYDYTNHKFHLQTPISPTSPTIFSSPTTPRPKQLAVPLSEYQKHGSAIWEAPKKSKRSVQFPRYKSSPRVDADPSSSSAPELSFTNPTPALSPPKHTRAVFGAKKKAESKEDRRREQLKARIKLVGPVNPHSYAKADPWV